MASCPDIDALQARLAAAIKKYENNILKQNVPHTHARAASYFLCTLLDETVLNTPWGSESNWGHNSLLIQFHNEAWGGEKFFDIVSHLSQQPSQNIALIELAYLCISLGLEGKYRQTGNGLRHIEGLRQELYLIMQRVKNTDNQELSLFWRGLGNIHNPLINRLPPWVLALVAAALLMLTYLGFSYTINKSSDHVFEQLAAIAQEEATLPAVQPVTPVARPEILTRSERFRRLLSDELQEEKVEVVDGNLLRILNAFPSGSAQLKDEYRPMMEKIAKELDTESSLIVVVGHTDAVPIFSARFPSNWHLSQERAKDVAEVLIAFMPQLQQRISSEGRAATEPIAPNDTAEGRARNRRIDIRIR
jgi:type VI secretion system protein ImpK